VLRAEAKAELRLRNVVATVAAALIPSAVLRLPILSAILLPGAVSLPGALLYPSTLLLPATCLLLTALRNVVDRGLL